MSKEKTYTAEELEAMKNELISKAIAEKTSANPNVNLPNTGTENVESNDITKSLEDLAIKKSGGTVRIEKAAANSQLSAGAGNGMINTEMGPRIPSINPGGYIRQYSTKYTQKENVMTMPYVSSTVSLTAGTELTAMAESNPVFAYLTFTLVPYQCTIPYSKQIARNAGNNGYNIKDIILEEVEIADDSTIDSLYKTRLQALGGTYNFSSLSGTTGIGGTGAGFSTSAQTFQTAITSTTLAQSVIGSTVGKLATINPNYLKNASLQMHPSVFTQLQFLADANNGRQLITFDANGQAKYINGMNIYQSLAFDANTVGLSAAGATFIGVCNLADAVVLSDAGGIDVELFNAGSTPGINLITQYAEAYRVVHEFDLQLKKRATFFGNY